MVAENYEMQVFSPQIFWKKLPWKMIVKRRFWSTKIEFLSKVNIFLLGDFFLCKPLGIFPRRRRTFNLQQTFFFFFLFSI